jgi:hypothetical protein
VEGIHASSPIIKLAAEAGTSTQVLSDYVPVQHLRLIFGLDCENADEGGDGTIEANRCFMV